MVITANANEFELTPGVMFFAEKEDIYKEWSELSPKVQERLAQIEENIIALIKEGVGLVQ